MTINDLDTKAVVDSQEKKSTQTNSPSGLESPIMEKAYYQTAAKVLNVPEEDYSKQEHKLRLITAFFKEKEQDMVPETLAWQLKDFLLRLGSPKLGEKMLDVVHRAIYLRMERDKLDSEIKKLGGLDGK